MFSFQKPILMAALFTAAIFGLSACGDEQEPTSTNEAGKAEELRGAVKDATAQAASKAAKVVEVTTEKASEAATETKKVASELAQETSETLKEAGQSATDAAKAAVDSVENKIKAPSVTGDKE